MTHFSIQNGQNITGDSHVTYGNTEIATLAASAAAQIGGDIAKASWVEITASTTGDGLEVICDAPSPGALRDTSAVVGWQYFLEA